MYHSIQFFSLPTFTFYIMKIPSMLVSLILYKKRRWNLKNILEVVRIVNEVRLESNNYTEKDTQNRQTFKVGYKVRERCVSIRCRFRKKATETEYERFKESVQNHTGNYCDEIEFNRGWCYFNVILDYEPIYDYWADRQKMSIGTGVFGLVNWSFAEYPHMLAVGETGQGKSSFVRYLLNALFSAGIEVWCIDGKCIDYVHVKDCFEYYAPNDGNKENLLKLIRKFEWQMRVRYEKMAAMGISDYRDDESYDPKFLLIDEYLVIVKSMNKDEKAELERLISSIVLLGRACGFILMVTMQRADAKYISGDMRDNFMLRVALGKASKQSLQMMFEVNDLKEQGIGKAWYKMGTDLGVLAIPFYKTIEWTKSDIDESKEGA